MATRHGLSGQVVSLREPRDPQAPAQATQAVIKAESLEVVHLALPAGGRLPMHAAPGEITLFGLAGTLTLELHDRRLQVGPGDFVHLARGEPHAVHAEGQVRALLTLCLHREPPTHAIPSTGHTGPRPPVCAPDPGAAEA